MAGSDKINLDPVAAAGEPMERLNARVAELERQLSNLRVPSMSAPKVATANSPDAFTAASMTYTSSGGYIIIFGLQPVTFGPSPGLGSGYGATVNMVVNGVTRDTYTVQGSDSALQGGSMAAPTLFYNAGKITAGTTLGISVGSASPAQPFSPGRIVVIELPTSG